MMKVVVLEEHYLHTNFHWKQLKTLGAQCPIYWFFWHFLSSWACDLDLGTKMKNRAPWGYAGAIGLTKYRNPCQIRQTPLVLGEDANWNWLSPKNMFFGRGSAHNGRITSILRKTQLDHDINLPPKFYQDWIKTHGAMLGTDRQTDRHTDTQQ